MSHRSPIFRWGFSESKETRLEESEDLPDGSDGHLTHRSILPVRVKEESKIARRKRGFDDSRCSISTKADIACRVLFAGRLEGLAADAISNNSRRMSTCCQRSSTCAASNDRRI